MNATPASVERVQKCVFNIEIYRFLKIGQLPHSPLPTYCGVTMCCALILYNWFCELVYLWCVSS